MKDKEEIKDLFHKYVNGSYSEEELELLLQYFELPKHSVELKRRIEMEMNREYDFENSTKGIDEVDSFVRDALFQKIRPVQKRKLPYLRIAIGIAASLLFVVSINYWSKPPLEEDSFSVETEVDILPGTNKAILQFDDGETIVLREDQSGILMDANQITYNDGTKLTSTLETKYATLTVPRAGHYQAVLPDGSRVWLNAETVLRYPTRFNGKTREVELEGEAYFEVIHKSDQPFIVKSNMQVIHVLGTSFNINSYRDESLSKTTLVEGSVQLVDQHQGVTKLKPGQQAITTLNGSVVKDVNVENYIAWKEGLIVLYKQNIQDVLQQLERWYDVTFVNPTAIHSQVELSGEIPRDINLSAILKALEEQLKVKFKTEERRIIIYQ